MRDGILCAVIVITICPPSKTRVLGRAFLSTKAMFIGFRVPASVYNVYMCV